MSWLAMFAVFGGYAALYWGAHLASHKGAGPVLYQAVKLGPSTYPGLAGCG